MAKSGRQHGSSHDGARLVALATGLRVALAQLADVAASLGDALTTHTASTEAASERVRLLEAVYYAAKARHAVWSRETYVGIDEALNAFEAFEKEFHAPSP